MVVGKQLPQCPKGVQCINPVFSYRLINLFCNDNPNCVTYDTGSCFEVVDCNTTYFRINGGDWFDYNIQIGALGEDGNNRIDYYSVDKAGNANEIKSFFIAQDVLPPETTIAEPLLWDGTLIFSCDDLVSGCDSLNYVIKDRKGNLITKIGDLSLDNPNTILYAPDSNTIIQSFAVLSGTDFYLDYNSSDRAGNIEETKTVMIGGFHPN